MAMSQEKSAVKSTKKGVPLTFHQLPLDPLPNLPFFAPILKLYDAKRAGRLMPRWQDFEFTEFVGWHAEIALSEREGNDLRFRIFGGKFVELFAQDMTGQLLAASMAPQQYEAIIEHFRRCIDGPKMGMVIGRVPTLERAFLGFQVLDLPLADSEGNVERFLHVTTSGSNEVDLPPL